MPATIQQISALLGQQGQIVSPQAPVIQVLTDSRTIFSGADSLFFAISGAQHNGLQYVEQAYAAGVRSFVVEKLPSTLHGDANYLLVENAIDALQIIAAAHRLQFQFPVIGITGSNGKTIVKEWLYHLLKQQLDIVRSPKSYNSQIGVPLSVWKMDERNELGIFEAGISQPGEMQKLQQVIRPTHGIITNISDPHREGFENDVQKLSEKLKLFKEASLLVFCADHEQISDAIKIILPNTKTIAWSARSNNADVIISDIEQLPDSTMFTLKYDEHNLHFKIPYSDSASLENSIHAIVMSLVIMNERKTLGAFTISNITIQAATLPVVSMRLELKRADHNSLLINDAYSADIASLEIALKFQAQHSTGLQRVVILSDFDQSGLERQLLVGEILKLLSAYQVDRIIGIGEGWHANNEIDKSRVQTFADTETCIAYLQQQPISNAVILIKGARRFTLERIGQLLELKTHGTALRIHLDHMVSNLQVYRSILKPGVKTMVMVKAFSYGSGQAEIARLLAHQRVDYLAVAYADEGVDLRRQGIRLPIMVMNPEPETFDQLLDAQLEPEIYSMRILNLWLQAVQNRKAHSENKQYVVHIKLDTGMHRLGFEASDIDVLIDTLQQHPHIHVAGIFTHLAATDSADHHAFTKLQLQKFESMSTRITDALGYAVIRHALNSSGISNYPEAQFDMVRLGIGLYGVDPSSTVQSRLKHVSTLVTNIAQIRNIQEGESVGYSCSFIAPKPMRIATINIGYADGFARSLSNGKGKVYALGNGHHANPYCPVVGRVCMDMTMIDITHLPHLREGDAVEIFGEHITISQHAEMQGTIAYEVMTGISQRVKRVYWNE
ncbi:MAG TPA: bifunctional UDP-N-acetylmuramoyl-tripeptide:D-alanyl-D-alanine ligase/alanine racemase [Chitinophagales bacterium]|nr:bifunctional UDP-N-acetylmuramoyl-tripeptide:D-alanyl-D-alanine ligase/alanine racemase [Chitinophagales bacterium]HNF68694.1 bifunctional UDP-N-acetylmuramoyl-tripeptide:D-alanyl-D-alanine ligase/alanine racemase [Chitinophagales bacterium]HNM29998.1 bifunctional UDP-N-acetylmuramoyl-tripeptide:D-alanyl-D-alanine ligase/alanine racemase [Chitinophagales bacterium]